MDANFRTSAEYPQIPTMKIAPNPIRQGDVLKIEGAQLKSVRLISYSGALMKLGNPLHNNLPMQGVPPGNYLLVVETSQGWMTEKIQVKN